MAFYKFGDITLYNHDAYEHTCKIEAETLDFALFKFLYSCDEFEKYVDDFHNKTDYVYSDCFHSYWKLKDNVNDDDVYISINEIINDKPKFIKKISLKEIKNFNFDDIERKCSSAKNIDTNSLVIKKENDLDLKYENLPSEFKEGKIKTLGDFINTKSMIRQRIEEIEKVKNELSSQIKEMEKWLKSKYRVICAYETYLGTHEYVVELIGEGKTSNKPIYFHQLVHYMDEEYGIVGLENITSMDFIEQKDFDYKDISFFDDWIKDHYQMYLPEERSICMWRIKRKYKEYNDPFYNMVENGKNMNCYFLIRNGERLYRIFSDVSSCADVMFPTEVLMNESEWRSQEDFENKMLPWKYILVAIQGLLDRTEILGTDCSMKYNLLTGFFDPSKIILVRDAEQDNLIEDKTRPTFRKFLEKNQNNVKVGDRILIIDLNHTSYGSIKNMDDFIWYHDMDYRRRYVSIPRTDKVYEVKDVKGEGYDKRYKILYFENDYWDEPRKKRTALWLKPDEIMNLSTLKEEDIKFYLNDRRERQNYLDILPKMKLAYIYFKTKAFEREDYYKQWYEG